MGLTKNKAVRQYNGFAATRSSIRRLENEIKVLKNQVDELIAQKIYSQGENRGADNQTLSEMRQAIESKEEIVLRLKLML